jgi:CBS domain-containing protein
VPTTASVEAVVHDWLMQSEERAFPVVKDEQLVGLVTLADVRKIPRDSWSSLPVTGVMTPASNLVVTSPGEGLGEALDKLARADVSQLPVVDGNRLVGVLQRRDVARWIELHVSPQPRRYVH